MNIQKFTQKSLEAVNGCEKLAYEFGNQEVDQEHLLYSLLTIDDSLILKLIEKMEINKEHFLDRSKAAIEKKTKVSGGQIYMSKALNEVLLMAEDEEVTVSEELPDTLEAPLKKGQTVGTVTYRLQGETVKTFPVYLTEDVEKITFRWCLDHVIQLFRAPFAFVNECLPAL